MARELAESVDPPQRLPPGRLVHVPGHGELFVRDTGGDGQIVLLLHGWMVSADLNWFRVYEPLREAGYRVLAPDHRGHGRGPRVPAPFSLEACAGDAAALVRELDCGPVICVGYSMGGPIALLLARDHPELVSGVVLGATALDWRHHFRMRWSWRLMGFLRLWLNLFPIGAWRWGLRRLGFPKSPITDWFAAELTRGSSRDIAEAGRDMGRFSAREWAGELEPQAAVIVSGDDSLVLPDAQRDLAAALGVEPIVVPGEHIEMAGRPERFVPALQQALAEVGSSAEPPIAPHAERRQPIQPRIE